MRSSTKIALFFIALSGFIFIVSLASIYTPAVSCGPFPVHLIIPLLSSLGILVGAVVFALMKEYGEKRDMEKILALLPEDERLVINHLWGKDWVKQKEIAELFGNKVKATRVLMRLEDRGVIEKREDRKIKWVRLRI